MNGLFKLFLLHSFGRRYGSVLIQFLDIFLQKEEGQRCQTYLWDENVAGMSEHGFEEEDVSGADQCQRYYLQDELGSPLRFVGADGILTETYGYDEFGCDIYQNQNEAFIAVVVAIIARKLGNISKLKEILGEDEWAAILDGLRRRRESCENDG